MAILNRTSYDDNVSLGMSMLSEHHALSEAQKLVLARHFARLQASHSHRSVARVRRRAALKKFLIDHIGALLIGALIGGPAVLAALFA